MDKKEMKMKYKMIAIAELYNQKPNDIMFCDGRFSENQMKGIKLLAEALQRAKKDGRIKDENHLNNYEEGISNEL